MSLLLVARYTGIESTCRNALAIGRSDASHYPICAALILGLQVAFEFELLPYYPDLRCSLSSQLYVIPFKLRNRVGRQSDSPDRAVKPRYKDTPGPEIPKDIALYLCNNSDSEVSLYERTCHLWFASRCIYTFRRCG